MNDIVNNKKGHHIVNSIMNNSVNNIKGHNIVDDIIWMTLWTTERDTMLWTT